jgi:hypothetical protein
MFVNLDVVLSVVARQNFTKCVHLKFVAMFHQNRLRFMRSLGWVVVS